MNKIKQWNLHYYLYLKKKIFKLFREISTVDCLEKSVINLVISLINDFLKHFAFLIFDFSFFIFIEYIFLLLTAITTRLLFRLTLTKVFKPINRVCFAVSYSHSLFHSLSRHVGRLPASSESQHSV